MVSLIYMGKNGGQITLTDVDGTSHQLSTEHVTNILGISWGAFFLSWILNGIYYKVLDIIFSSVIIIH